MKAFYKAIEDKIKASGYTGFISGENIYDDICEEIEDKENGSYIFMCKQEDDTYYEYKIDVMDDSFNLAYMIIHTGEKDWHITFDN
ncbi:MAG: hypothetical protein E7231_06080 [Cellulosilyticum sp.]|nr:hypothetical protein [Cellulosilyticum sp.]